MIEIILTTLIGVCAISLAVIAIIQYQSYSNNQPEGFSEMQIKSYGNIMEELIDVNQRSVELAEEDRYEVEQKKYVSGRESKLDKPMRELMHSYQESYYIISEDVQEAVGEYIDHMSKSNHEADKIETQLILSGDVVQAMRADLGMPDLFPDDQTNKTVETA